MKREMLTKAEAEGIERRMFAAKVSQTDVAEHFGVSQATVSHWLNCRRMPPTFFLAEVHAFIDQRAKVPVT